MRTDYENKKLHTYKGKPIGELTLEEVAAALEIVVKKWEDRSGGEWLTIFFELRDRHEALAEMDE